MRAMAGGALALALALAQAGCADRPEPLFALDLPPSIAVQYEIDVSGYPESAVQEQAEAALVIYREQDAGAPSLALLGRRATDDVELLERILRSQGYYKASVAHEVVANPGPTLPDEPGLARVLIEIDAGTPFTLQSHAFKLLDHPEIRLPASKDLGSPVGAQAVAREIVDSEKAAVSWLENNGYPYARSAKRRAVANLESGVLDIDTPLRAGPSSVFGPVTIRGLDAVEERYLRTYVPWDTGDVFDLSLLREYRRDLLETDLFNSITVKPPETPPDGDEPVVVPILVEVEERFFRTVSTAARVSSEEGPLLALGLQHRNVAGANEIVSLDIEAARELQQGVLSLRKPQVGFDDNDLVITATLRNEEDEAFDDTTATVTAGFEREVDEVWTLGYGLVGEASEILNDGIETRAYLGGFAGFADYDGSDDDLDPTKGFRARFGIAPFIGTIDAGATRFLMLDGTASTYFDILDDKTYVLAFRGRAATILAEDLLKVPETRRLYAGGGGSVRGFEQRFVGPLDLDEDPTGGLSALELGAEIRAKLFGDLGAAAFVEAGSVSEETVPDFENGVQVAAGLGIRYLSPAGPIRLDVAVPLNRRPADDIVQFYFSIGQAF
ncbi:MAG: BamA/TamA family outer membrane protein [Pseudomonadota bacterium]